MKHLHRLRWGASWEHFRETVLRIWSRSNFEAQDTFWTSKIVLPCIFVKGVISRGDRSTWTCEVRAIEEAEKWKLC